jgi:hypothetical protein
MTLLYGIAAIALLWWLSQKFAQANPTALARALRVVTGILAFGGAGVMALRGRIDMAILLGGVGAWLLGWSVFSLPWMRQSTQRTPGSISRVRSVMIEMELDHDTGSMDGTVLAGAHLGRRLNELDATALQHVYAECRVADADGVRLLEAYLDRRFPGWRENAQGDDHPRTSPRGQPGAMTEEEAYQVLGLQPGAGAEDIRRAHRALMKKLHPDQGGSTYLAARVNQAKEILLNRHR